MEHIYAYDVISFAIKLVVLICRLWRCEVRSSVPLYYNRNQRLESAATRTLSLMRKALMSFSILAFGALEHSSSPKPCLQSFVAR